MNEKRVAIITGAAGGIGTAIVERFGRDGYHLSLVDREAEKLSDLSSRLKQAGATVQIHTGDLADLSYCESLVRATAERFGRVDVLVNNAAIHAFHTMRSITVESWEQILRVNLTVPAFLAKWAAEEMEKNGGGVIVNISSIEAIHPTPMGPAYVSAKGALDSLTYSLSNLYAPSGIRVVSVRPGAIDTSMSQDYLDDMGRSLTDVLREESDARIPLGRWGTADEIAGVVAWLASDDASYITGTHIVADGGWTRNRTRYDLIRRMKPDDIR